MTVSVLWLQAVSQRTQQLRKAKQNKLPCCLALHLKDYFFLFIISLKTKAEKHCPYFLANIPTPLVRVSRLYISLIGEWLNSDRLFMIVMS
jgi:hypothetical protein